MEYENVEKYLLNFKINGPNEVLRDRILLQSKSAWTDTKASSFRFRLRPLASGYAYAFGLVLLVSIISSRIDSLLTNNLLNGKTMAVKHIVEVNDMEKLCEEMGIDYKPYRVLVGVTFMEDKSEPQSNMFEQRNQIMKELNLMNGGPS